MSKETDQEKADNSNEEQEAPIPSSEAHLDKDKALEELAAALEAEKKRSDGYLNRLKYVQADFENLKKRLDRQLEDVRKYCNERLVLELLGIADELEAAVRESKQTKLVEVLLNGVEMTLKKLKKVLEAEEVSPIDCVGQTFDPAKHEAVAKIENHEEGKIIEEIRKGYTMKGRVIRPSVVKITVKPSPETTEVKADEP